MKTKNLFLIIVLLLAILSCKKHKRYPENPKTLFAGSPKSRLVGVWQINEYTLNGNSILDQANFGADITNYMIISSYDGTTKKYSYSLINSFDDESHLTFGPFSNTANCSYIKCFITPLKCTNTSKTTDWTITKLYGNDLHLILQTDTGEFKIFYKKIHN
jgi:hypothetical protein